MTRLYLSEVFFSIQGEGSLTGVPSAFVRTSGCNLRCVWCDTPYASWEPEGEWYEVDDVLARLATRPHVRHVVLTGGEPLVAAGVPELARVLCDDGYHVTVETAGTVDADVPMHLCSISPKLAHSTPGPEHGEWARRHEQRRLDVTALQRLIDRGEYQLKFVVAAPSDLDEIDALLGRLSIDRADRVQLMPRGRSVAELDATASWLVPLCLERGFRFCDRQQIRLFGDSRGT